MGGRKPPTMCRVSGATKLVKSCIEDKAQEMAESGAAAAGTVPHVQA